MDKIIEIKDEKLLEAFPEVKVLKELEPRRVAYYVAVSATPEADASKVIIDWAKEKGLIGENGTSRIFGFNNPNPTDESHIYGYEIQITVDDDFVSDDERIEIKEVPGGLYAVKPTTVSRIFNDWQSFIKWIEMSEYEYDERQEIEEMLTLEGDLQIDLYLPIKESEASNFSL